MTDRTHAADLLTVKDAAGRLALSPSAVYELCRSGLLPHVRIGARRGRIRIRPADLDAYLKAAEDAATGGLPMEPAASKDGRRSAGRTQGGGYETLRRFGYRRPGKD